ncbi:peptide deformylase [Candidatus Saccharibacteria bacterium]|nr:peptide deformylase [Candidatus Saccharibacteria bacterium]
MSKKAEIIAVPDGRLREKAEKVSEVTDEVRGIIRRMTELSLEWEKDHPHELSAAMAAPQMGELVRVIIIRENMDDKEDASWTALINPVVVATDGPETVDFEGCLSVPNIYGKVKRPRKVRIKAMLEDGTPVRVKATEGLARTLLHEIDHLDGVLFIDHIKGEKDAFYRLTDKGELAPLDYETQIKDNEELWGGGE